MQPLFSVHSYHGSENLGDAIQTIALARLMLKLGCTSVATRDRDSGIGATRDDVFVCNGYLDGRWNPSPAAKTIFAGVHVKDVSTLRTLSNIHSTDSFVGARDPHTYSLLEANGIPCRRVGCATLTLDRYDGPRSGTVLIDAWDGFNDLTQRIPKDMTWEDQHTMASGMLELIQKSSLVITRRLHIALPCLAFGTPVMMPHDTPQSVFDPERLSIMDVLGFQYGSPQVMSVSGHALQFTSFLEWRLAHSLNSHHD